MNDKSLDCLVKIVLYCDAIEERIERFSLSRDNVINDAALADLVLMPLAQIGELSVHVNDDILRTIMPLPVWKQIRGFRNVIVHNYGSIDRDWAWATVVDDVPELRSCILSNAEVNAAYATEVNLIASEQDVE